MPSNYPKAAYSLLIVYLAKPKIIKVVVWK